ncbi:diguanylate cyclase [Streptomyces chartreusis]|uniref:diguanylate cyclase n=1 Tax=Streptomyces chartreusis TaxID=1969 RepID=UPI0036D12C00
MGLSAGSAFVVVRRWRRAGAQQPGPHPTDVEATARRFLLLERTSGAKESGVHALMMTETGVPVVMGLLARVNPLVLTTMGAAAIAHGATAVYDVWLATGEREVRPIEQHIHSFLEVLPLTALAFTACLHPDQVRSTLRGGPRPQDWRLLPKERPLPPAYLAGLACVIGLGVVVPYAEELRRCLRARPAAA